MVERWMELMRIMIDFGLVTLIMMIQLIVYPSFTYFQPGDLVRWHQKYTPKITLIVAPLMFAQLGVIFWQFLYAFNWLVLTSSILVAAAWLNTFFYAVPKHELISKKENVIENAHELVKVNRYRVLVWSLVWLLGLIDWWY